MNRVIIRLALRECWVYVTPILVLLILFVLFPQNPLRFYETPIAVLSLLLGFFLAQRSFADAGNIRAFLFSRAWSPSRLFLVRWLFGLGVIFVTGLVIALLIALGVRQALQQSLFANGWFPIVRYHELGILICYGFLTLLSYNTTAYFVLANRYWGPVRLRGFALALRHLGTVLLTILGTAILIGLLVLAGMDLVYEPGYPVYLIPYVYLVFGLPAVIQTALMPAFGVYCYKNQEIES